MSQAISRDLIDFLRDRAGEYLRAVVRYDRDSRELLYCRRDVGRTFSNDDLDRVVEAVRREPVDSHRPDGLDASGDLRCIVRVFDGAVELHFPHAPDSGTVVALEPAAATRLHTFVDDCLDNAPEERQAA